MVRVAILDMNNNVPNLGLGNIVDIVKEFSEEVECQVFDVRHKKEVPDTSWDIYISSGGPGDPLEGDGDWDKRYYDLMDALWHHNLSSKQKKYAFFICHSFQMMVHHLQIADIVPRRSMSFGTFPVHKTAKGEKERYFQNLPDPFYAADFRHWQVLNPNVERLEATGAKILALEKIRPDVDLERAIMAIRFSEEFFGTQFHPEANPVGMLMHFRAPEKYHLVLEKFDSDKYQTMIDDIHNPQKVSLTHDELLPRFMNDAIYKVKKLKAVEVEQLV